MSQKEAESRPKTAEMQPAAFNYRMQNKSRTNMTHKSFRPSRFYRGATNVRTSETVRDDTQTFTMSSIEFKNGNSPIREKWAAIGSQKSPMKDYVYLQPRSQGEFIALKIRQFTTVSDRRIDTDKSHPNQRTQITCTNRT